MFGKIVNSNLVSISRQFAAVKSVDSIRHISLTRHVLASDEDVFSDIEKLLTEMPKTKTSKYRDEAGAKGRSDYDNQRNKEERSRERLFDDRREYREEKRRERLFDGRRQHRDGKSRERSFDDRRQYRDGKSRERSFDDRRQYREERRLPSRSQPSYQREESLSKMALEEEARCSWIGEPLGIFSEKNVQESELKTWSRLSKEQKDVLFKSYPRNSFDEMILLTEEGKLWTYPIDNEAGLDEEAKVPFYEHIFVDDLLYELPNSEPVKDFMEIMSVAITNNPYMTHERKKILIRWYVDYFKDKKEILKQLGALSTD